MAYGPAVPIEISASKRTCRERYIPVCLHGGRRRHRCHYALQDSEKGEDRHPAYGLRVSCDDRQVVGDYDENTDSYLIKEGLATSDYIAFPDEGIEDGCPVTTNFEEYMQQYEGEEGSDNGTDDNGENIGSDSYSDFTEENTFSTDYLTDEELMQDLIITEEETSENTPENVDETVIPNESGQ